MRNNSIESVRFLAAFSVILIHFFPAFGNEKLIVDQLCRFAVPFFFIVSGYFLGIKAKENESSKLYYQYAGRIFILYLFWSFIYIINPDFHEIYKIGIVNYYQSVFDLITSNGFVTFLLGFGIAPHLWFFVSLISSVLLFSLFKIKNIKWFLAVSILFFVLANMGKAYVHSPIGFYFLMDTRYFLFFSSLPIALGIYIAYYGIKVTNKIAVLIIISGLLLHFSEFLLVKHFYNSSELYDFVFTTPIMGLGVFLFALNNNSFLNNSTLAKLGGLSLGIFVIHFIIGWKVISFFDNFNILQQCSHFTSPLVILFISTIIVFVLKKNKYIKRFL